MHAIIYLLSTINTTDHEFFMWPYVTEKRGFCGNAEKHHFKLIKEK